MVRPDTQDCVIIDGTLVDPYTGTTFDFVKEEASEVQIDHIVPLSLAWHMGASQWDEAMRTAFANDPLNLLAVDGSANLAKGDFSIASWLPSNRVIRC